MLKHVLIQFHEEKIINEFPLGNSLFGTFNKFRRTISTIGLKNEINLFQDNIHKLFRNIKQIVIYSTHKEHHYPFDLSLLLHSIKKLWDDYRRNDIEVTIKASWVDDKQRSWLDKQMNEKYQEIYQKKIEWNMGIQTLTPDHYDGYREDKIMIKWMR